MKLSVKSSSAAKLFNAVHKAQVSWKRIHPLLNPAQEQTDAPVQQAGNLEVKHLSFTYPDGRGCFI